MESWENPKCPIDGTRMGTEDRKTPDSPSYYLCSKCHFTYNPAQLATPNELAKDYILQVLARKKHYSPEMVAQRIEDFADQEQANAASQRPKIEDIVEVFRKHKKKGIFKGISIDEIVSGPKR